LQHEGLNLSGKVEKWKSGKVEKWKSGRSGKVKTRSEKWISLLAI
jgi:hypothetical protein